MVLSPNTVETDVRRFVKGEHVKFRTIVGTIVVAVLARLMLNAPIVEGGVRVVCWALLVCR